VRHCGLSMDVLTVVPDLYRCLSKGLPGGAAV